MDRQSRERQWRHCIEACIALRGSRDAGFAGWEAVMLLCAAMAAVDAWFERQGMEAPKSHRQRRRMIKKHLPLVYEHYNRLCALGERAMYRNGHAMDDRHRHEARRLHESILKIIPWPEAP